MHVTKQEDIDKKGNMHRDSLCLLLSKNPEGIILDLRVNAGVNSAPMQSGIGSLFRSSLLGYSVDRDSNLQAEIRLEDGVAKDGKGKSLLI